MRKLPNFGFWGRTALEHLRPARRLAAGGELPLAAHQAAALAWVRRYTVPGQGIAVNHVDKHTAYPEVTGYYIPTLLAAGETALALQYARWLLSIQNPDGSWNAPGNGQPYVFDTGQILKGLVAIAPQLPEALPAAKRGAAWLLGNQRADGSIGTPDQAAWSGEVPEAVHLYCLSPILDIAKLTQTPELTAAVRRAVAFYTADVQLTEFTMLSHFHAYILEALVDVGETKLATAGLKKAMAVQLPSGAIPAFANASWVCSTGLLQYSIVVFKLGQAALGHQLLRAALMLQNASGGFYGSYGAGAAYFPRAEIGWAVKYALDAIDLAEHNEG